MTAIYYHPKGHKHHFRGVEVNNGKADLKSDAGQVLYKGIQISNKPESGKAFIADYQPTKPKTKK